MHTFDFSPVGGTPHDRTQPRDRALEPGQRLAGVPRRGQVGRASGLRPRLDLGPSSRPIFGDTDQPIFEGYTALAAVAQATERVRASGCSSGRTPSATRVSRSNASRRSTTSAVGARSWAWGGLVRARAHAFGIDFGSGFGQRLDWLAEADGGCPRPARWRRGDEPGRVAATPSTTSGPLPLPVQRPLPIMIGGGGEKKTLRIVAEHADIWNVFGTPDVLVHKDDILREHCADVGRDPGDDRALGRLQDHDPRTRGRGRTRPAGHPRAQSDAARARRGRRHVLDRHARADRRDDDRLPTDRLPHLPRRATRRRTTPRRWRP